MNLQQAKALFFALHFGQMVIKFSHAEDLEPLKIKSSDLQFEPVIDASYLLLRSSDNLTDAELKVFAKHSAYRLDEINITKVGRVMVKHLFRLNSWSGNTILILTDYLRSIGVLIHFTYIDETGNPVTLSPEQIIALGWAKYANEVL